MSHVSRNCPDNPERIAEYQERYAAILRDQRPDSSEQLRAAFLEQMKGREYGEGPLLSAFAWFWNGWAASSGARAAASESRAPNSEIEALRKKQVETVMPLIGNLLDQWDGMPNDLKDYVREVHEGFTQAMRDIQDGMEGKHAARR